MKTKLDQAHANKIKQTAAAVREILKRCGCNADESTHGKPSGLKPSTPMTTGQKAHMNAAARIIRLHQVLSGRVVEPSENEDEPPTWRPIPSNRIKTLVDYLEGRETPHQTSPPGKPTLPKKTK